MEFHRGLRKWANKGIPRGFAESTEHPSQNYIRLSGFGWGSKMP